MKGDLASIVITQSSPSSKTQRLVRCGTPILNNALTPRYFLKPTLLACHLDSWSSVSIAHKKKPVHGIFWNHQRSSVILSFKAPLLLALCKQENKAKYQPPPQILQQMAIVAEAFFILLIGPIEFLAGWKENKKMMEQTFKPNKLRN